jgi:hypothetical protein
MYEGKGSGMVQKVSAGRLGGRKLEESWEKEDGRGVGKKKRRKRKRKTKKGKKKRAEG